MSAPSAQTFATEPARAESSGRAHAMLATMLALATGAMMVAGLLIGSLGWMPWTAWHDVFFDPSSALATVVWEVRLPRTLCAWLAGALLGLSGAIAQGLFRNPLADPYLLGSAAGANLAVALLLIAVGATPGLDSLGLNLGLTGAAFCGAVLAVLLTLTLARGTRQPLRLLLAGVVVSMVLGALASLAMARHPQLLQAMQVFMLGTTAFAGWTAAGVLAIAAVGVVLPAWACARALDVLSLGIDSARSLGLPLGLAQAVLIGALALGTAAAVAQVGLVAFIGLVAPHLVRLAVRPLHRSLLLLSALMGGALLLAADILARAAMAPQELPVGVLTALLGGVYLLWMMSRRQA